MEKRGGGAVFVSTLGFLRSGQLRWRLPRIGVLRMFSSNELGKITFCDLANLLYKLRDTICLKFWMDLEQNFAYFFKQKLYLQLKRMALNWHSQKPMQNFKYFKYACAIIFVEKHVKRD